ncbi:uncharacterized protein A1O5_01078 [Cladophialophora psammophila CBS 110553]|uniref:Uncharacterized protein n=1 Tax=Cladophialophora psammophila CBS 110553 TaxID=1182543 RepID=W9XGV4_9EURO|nr:uncharacterized protein A1O5_01078 [Cladophialophora psammophila CBS 110553]EXJ76570.1 hypothetical protein A1O5_01078 [Cladophialophora psammophila CBS 110553]
MVVVKDNIQADVWSKGFPKHDETGNWGPMFKSTIDGVLKVAGSDAKQVKTKLQAMLKALQHSTVIINVASPSRLDGHTKPKPLDDKHFGFEDAISQPSIEGIDTLEGSVSGAPNMNTDANIIVVSNASSPARGGEHPAWMEDGIFLVSRKHEQDVKAVSDLIDKWATNGCTSRE